MHTDCKYLTCPPGRRCSFAVALSAASNTQAPRTSPAKTAAHSLRACQLAHFSQTLALPMRSPGTWTLEQARAAGIKGRATRARNLALRAEVASEAARIVRAVDASTQERLESLLSRLITLSGTFAGTERGERCMRMAEACSRTLRNLSPSSTNTPKLEPLDG